MTTEVIGTLPCPECNHETELKSDGRKHTLKCHHCGVLAYYQTQQAKTHVEERLKNKVSSPSQAPHDITTGNVVTLQLPNTSDAQQRYILSLEPMVAIEPVDGTMGTCEAALPANDEDQHGNDTSAAETSKPKRSDGFLSFLDDVF